MDFYQALELATEEWELDAILSASANSSHSSVPSVPDTSPKARNTPSDWSKSAQKKGEKAVKWTAEEDQQLKTLVPKLKPDWKKIAEYFPGRPKSVVRRRWENRFDPDIKKTPWSEEEDVLILTLLGKVGPVWKEIATHMQGRPPDAIKNRYYGHIKRQKAVERPAEVSWEELINVPMKPQSPKELAGEVERLERLWQETQQEIRETEESLTETD